MLECLAQTAQVVSGMLTEPLTQPPVDFPTSLFRQLGDGCGSDQVVQKSHGSGGLRRDASCDELCDGVLGALGRPFLEGRDVRR